MPSTLRNILWPFLLLFFGIAAAATLCPMESEAVAQEIIGYPNSVIPAYTLRPWLLGFICLIPFIASVAYRFCDTLDRYTLRTFLSSFAICFLALYFILFLEDFQDNISDFKKSEMMLQLLTKHYLTRLPALLVFILPYALMLALLWSLGKMSKSQEIVSMVQTGRSVPRIVAPLIGFGLLAAAVCMICNYHWAPYADSQEQNILAEAKGIAPTEAKHVAYQSDDDQRQWYIGSFPQGTQQGEPLQSVNISVMNSEQQLAERIVSSSATWSLNDRKWTFTAPLVFDYSSPEISATKHTEDLIFDWPETPFQIINPGLKPPYLGVPELTSWLSNHREHPLSDKRAYLTHWHYRFAQPFICLITILLAAPLGIVFNRRGVGGGVAVAIFLCAGMIFCSTVFTTLGESGHLSPLVAAWATNIIFTIVALTLFHRRMTGQPIYQTVIGWFRS